jgi:hypothetical protein
MAYTKEIRATWASFATYRRLLIVGLLGCNSSTGPGLSVASGTYALELVDGHPLPVAFETGTCPREINAGELDLTPSVAEQDPSYIVFVFLRSQCDPTAVLPVDRAEAVRDVGEWSLNLGMVWFSSDQKRGGYRAPLEQPLVGDQGPLLTLQFDGRSYTFRRTWIYQPGGHPG